MATANSPKYKNWGEYLYWVYANLNMCNAALTAGKEAYDRQSFIIRSKAFKAYKEGRWHIRSLYANNNWKMDWGKDFCWYCGKPVEECGKLTAEHIFPRAKGGDDSFDNIAYACRQCNSSKGDKDLVEWMIKTLNKIPPFNLVCIYMKLVYKYSVENNLLELHSEDLKEMVLPFNYMSVVNLEHIIKEVYVGHSNKEEGSEP